METKQMCLITSLDLPNLNNPYIDTTAVDQSNGCNRYRIKIRTIWWYLCTYRYCLEFADWVLNGEIEVYLNAVIEYKILDQDASRKNVIFEYYKNF